jgi:hypothetical protein
MPDHIELQIYPSPAEAPTYRPPEFKAAIVTQACVVRQGTKDGRSTTDLVFVDSETGQKFVALNTGRIIRALAAAIGDEG